ncbi:MAG: DUF4815 domain-containing protein [Actinomycetota bacterium]|nr:DUF4815 domain-containing protein [Actinomycetota bacterium]
MKGDFSRFTFDAGKRYTSVRLQQGRVSLDSDWNEQAAIDEHVARLRFVDAVGNCAAPTRDGFALRARGSALELSPGRMYVGGLPCELDRRASLHEVSAGAIVPSRDRTDLLYVDAWERHVTALQDPDLLEPALGGSDTTTRLQVAWKLVALENVRSTSRTNPAALLPRPPTGTMRASAPDPYAGENRLYRVEIHDGGDPGEASFKWSRDNGSVVFGIDEIVAPRALALTPFPRNSTHALDLGAWVEVSGDESERRGRSGTLARVEELEAASRVAVLDRDVSERAAEGHALLRRWDGKDGSTPVPAEAVELEAGISVRFSAGSYRSGDYWTIPARAGTPSEWAGDEAPHGVEHRLCPLAFVTWRKSARGWTPSIRDCRRLFSPLTHVERELAQLRSEVAELRRRVGEPGGTR